MKRRLIALSLLFLVGCSQTKPNNTINIVTSFYPLYDFATKIGGDKVSVHNVLPNGVDAHSFEPSPKDMVAIQESDLFIYHGAGLEAWVPTVLKSLSDKNIPTVAVSDGVVLLENQDHDDHDHDDHDHGVSDPHTWLSPTNAKKEMAIVKDKLVEIDPDNAAYYTKNYDVYATALSTLDKDFRTAIEGVQTREFLVDHLAFAYLAHDYDLVQKGVIQGLLSEEPTPKELELAIEYIENNNIKVIFAVPTESSKVVDVVVKETGVTVLPLYTIESLTGDQIKDKQDYFTLMQKNIESLKEGLTDVDASH
ncbi:zinc ABC transporter solute-binding protein [Erysipelothrix sp. HDW6C]|uniref:metal ABC transporter solute-binding protein, Zn/Mn family n=1 Tax=Erysipelothrix sp. HDW6C TaxID=2714930 RepID=UPI00140BA062|nr:zinc ABC transporter substrate-binding protein [Erysipelothrix sp. HDW6C]QIK70143.1 zinc ABC transporter solute-binding protein [Erysipelothrix sp. HDW6C]